MDDIAIMFTNTTFIKRTIRRGEVCHLPGWHTSEMTGHTLQKTQSIDKG